MKIRNKIISILLISILISISLTGCSPKGSEDLLNAFRKSSEMNSYNSKTHMDIALDFDMDMSQMGENEQMMINMYKGMFQDIEADLEQKLMKDEEDNYLVEQDLSYNFGGMGFKMKMWQDYSLSDDEFRMKQVIEIPGLFKPFITELTGDVSNVQYLEYDWSDYMELMEEEDINFDMKELTKLGKELGVEFQDTFFTVLDEFQEQYKNDHDVDIISYIGNEKIDGQKIDIYEMNFNDSSFKDFLRFAVNYTLEKDDTEDLIEEYLTIIGNLVYEMDPYGSSKDEIESDIEEMLQELDLEEVNEKFDEFMDVYEDVELLGDDGISLTYKVNRDDYIVGVTGVVDLVFDIKEIGETLREAYPNEFEDYYYEEELPVIYFVINFDVNISDINQEQDIEFPELTKENSLNLIDLLEEESQYYNY